MINVAVIPARGGSKRIHKKNIREFCGKPIIAYSIEAAINSGLFDRVIVSTDDRDIVDISKKYGAEVPFIRPLTLADDHTGTNDVVIHAIKALEAEGEKIAYVCCIYATAPFLQKEFIQRGLEQLQAAENKHYAFSVCKFNYPVQRSFTIESNERNITLLEPESIGARSQDLPEVFHDAGQFYWGLAQDFVNLIDGGMFSPFAIPIVLPNYLVQDIDDEGDWRRAEYMYKALMADIEGTLKI
ncbi:MAG: pseudaminic acid cytidylyltransferase [Colwellia sp.]|nr:pseudaminic acid cytidylyltransferase [Colwellia sp.]